jgi:hypothetical protein
MVEPESTARLSGPSRRWRPLSIVAFAATLVCVPLFAAVGIRWVAERDGEFRAARDFAMSSPVVREVVGNPEAAASMDKTTVWTPEGVDEVTVRLRAVGDSSEAIVAVTFRRAEGDAFEGIQISDIDALR